MRKNLNGQSFRNIELRGNKCEKAIYRMTKSRDQASKVNYQGYFVKAKDDNLLMKTEENINRWAENYRHLFNKPSILTAERNY